MSLLKNTAWPKLKLWAMALAATACTSFGGVSRDWFITSSWRNNRSDGAEGYPAYRSAYTPAFEFLNDQTTAYMLYARYAKYAVAVKPGANPMLELVSTPPKNPVVNRITSTWDEFYRRDQVQKREELVRTRIQEPGSLAPLPKLVFEYFSRLGEYDFKDHRFPLLQRIRGTYNEYGLTILAVLPLELCFPGDKISSGGFDLSTNSPLRGGYQPARDESWMQVGVGLQMGINPVAGTTSGWATYLSVDEARGRALITAAKAAQKAPGVLVRVYGRFDEADLFSEKWSKAQRGNLKFVVEHIDIFDALSRELLRTEDVAPAPEGFAGPDAEAAAQRLEAKKAASEKRAAERAEKNAKRAAEKARP